MDIPKQLFLGWKENPKKRSYILPIFVTKLFLLITPATEPARAKGSLGPSTSGPALQSETSWILLQFTCGLLLYSLKIYNTYFSILSIG